MSTDSADPSVRRADDQPVIAWPKITAAIDDESSGTLVINGVVHPCRAETIEALRTGMIARCTATAIRLGRAVRVDVTESGRSWALAVRPDGIVQEIDRQGRIVPADGELGPIEGSCRRCGDPNPVSATHCAGCGTGEPLSVLATEPSTTMPAAGDSGSTG